MTIALSIFAFALIGLVIFFALRIRAIRKGIILVPERGRTPEHITDALNVAEIKNRLQILAQMWGRRVILLSLKYSIKLTYFIRKKLDILFMKIQRRFLHHHNKIIAREGTSPFLNEIEKHKEEIRKKTEI